MILKRVCHSRLERESPRNKVRSVWGGLFFVKLFAFDNIINYISVEIVMSFALILVIET